MSILDAFIRVVTLPIAAALDVVTMGGVLTDRDESYTGEQIKHIGEDIEGSGRD